MSSLGNDTKFWRSLKELRDTDELREVVESEFPEQAEELSDPVSRRGFMQLMGASIAFAGVAGAGCRRWEKDEIVPLSERPPGYVPGVSQYFATAMELGGVGIGILAESFDGRPVKLEGNDNHPFSAGGTTAFAQASILGLYDPDRSGSVRGPDGAGSWDFFETLVRDKLSADNGAGLRVLSAASSSPTLARLKARFLARYPQAEWHSYEPLSDDNERAGLQMAFSQPLRALAHLDKATRIVAVDADLFGAHPAMVRYSKDFAAGRDPDGAGRGSDKEINRLYAIESAFSTTGVMADHRLPVASSLIPELLGKLEALLQGGTVAGDDKASRFITAMAKDLGANRGRGVIIAGPRQPAAVHAMVARLNSLIGAYGRTLEYLAVSDAAEPAHMESIKTLGADMNAKRVKALVILGGNPVYDAPADVAFEAGLANVEVSVHLGEYADETSAACTWHLPASHYLESWGDTRSYDGTVSIVQPIIEPLWDSKSAIEVISLFTEGSMVAGATLVRQSFDELFGGVLGGGELAWRKALHDGFIAGTRFAAVVPAAPATVPMSGPAQPLGPQSLEVVLTPSSHAYDGRFANNGWLQETPDFLTKLTWDNAALVNPHTAEELGLDEGDLIEVSVGERKVTVPVYTLPGQAKYSLALALGHGRTHAGRIAGSVDDKVAPTGFDVYPLLAAAAPSPFVATGATVRKIGGSYKLASTQDHWKIDASGLVSTIGPAAIAKRVPQLTVLGTVAEYKANPDFARERAHNVVMPIDNAATEGNGKSLWEEHEYDGPREGSQAIRYKWGMAIDMSKCVGCNACMLACQSENNVPIVGKKQVANNREMHWIRIDRYFTGSDILDNPQVVHQPVTCQQCENAPCEQVCPVGATIHSEEGLNDMVYNRCVGTRYCSNNCPYKVRRFNFLNFQDRSDTPGGAISDARNRVRQYLFNPDVTVRSRGVMEKCTFCVQRIQNGKIAAKNERRKLRDGEVETACQQACPADAISFGDLNDKNSNVSRAHAKPRSYELLGEFNTKPRNLFMARIRNPNPELG